MTLRERFAALLRQHRGERLIVDVADAIGVSDLTIEYFEAGETLPRLPTYIRLCRAYNLTPAQRAELDELAAGMAAGGGE